MSVTLPTPESNSGSNDWADVYQNDAALKEAVEALETQADSLEGELESLPLTWKTPKIIATEESRENSSFGTLTTADEITGVVLPENGLIVVGYAALAKCSVEGAGTAAIFLGNNQVKVAAAGAPAVQEVTPLIGDFRQITTSPGGLVRGSATPTSYVTTGQLLATKAEGDGGLAVIFAGPGTYTVSVRYKASSGTVTAKERKLWVGVFG